MAGGARVRDAALLDALEALPPVPFRGTVWRVVRDGRHPCQCSAAGGRWDDRTFDVLYTSTAADGAVAEMHFHVSRGQPVIPSRVVYRLHELRVALHRSLRLVDLAALKALGLDVARYGRLSYVERGQEYPQSQEIAEAARFFGFDGLIAPSARWQCLNVVPFCDEVLPDALEAVRDRGPIDWARWQREPLGF